MMLEDPESVFCLNREIMRNLKKVSPEQPILISAGPTKNKKNVSGATKNTGIFNFGCSFYFWLLLNRFWLLCTSF